MGDVTPAGAVQGVRSGEPQCGGHMNLRGGRRGPRTWLAIQARTYASTSGDLRTLAHVRASNSRSVTLSTMGDRRIAASNAYKRAPVLMMLFRPLPGLTR